MIKYQGNYFLTSAMWAVVKMCLENPVLKVKLNLLNGKNKAKLSRNFQFI